MWSRVIFLITISEDDWNSSDVYIGDTDWPLSGVEIYEDEDTITLTINKIKKERILH